MSKGKTPHEHCKAYLNSKRRIRNKTRRLEKRIQHLLKEREKGITVRNNNKLEIKRRPIENIQKSCRIGRKKEGFEKEACKKCKSKVGQHE